MLVLNEGVIRHGQTTAGAFDPIIGHPDFAAIVKDGVRPVFMRRLTCLSVLRERGIGPYDVLERKPEPLRGQGQPDPLSHDEDVARNLRARA